ncbi:MAG: sigma-70 family RNA polymerase sigma factor [Chryseosolibacter sp.]
MSDDHIIALIRSGGQPELGMVYEKYRIEFIHWITKEFHCSEDDSKDIYQLTILIFYDNIKSGKLEHLVSSVKTYLFGIGKNVARDNMRKSRRNTPINQEKWLKEFLVDEADEPVDESLFMMARNALMALGEPCRQLVEMYYYERRSMEEISERLNYKNADTAKNQKCKCMARLRKLFEREVDAAHIPTTI